MDNRQLTRLALAGSVFASVIVLARNRAALLGLLPRPLKDAVKSSVLYQAGTAPINRLQIARLAAKGKLFSPAPLPAEAARRISEWEQAGRPIPGPGVFKQDVLRSYGQEFGLTILIETGTYVGDTPAALKGDFRRIYSIELNPELVRRVKVRFRDDPHITILHGDSEERLPAILAEITEPTLFWLDGHHSSGITAHGSKVTPILGELDTVLSHAVKEHIILIDDAREFQHVNGYPTLDELREFVAVRRPELRFEVKDDIIRLTMG